jgi:cytochrome c oxidase subunit III
MGSKTIVSTTSAPPSGEIQLDFSIGGNRGGGSGSENGNRISTLPRGPNPTAAETGIWVVVAAISMSFAALISAMIVRQGAAPDWLHFRIPRILYLNTLVLLVSSVTLEVSRHWFASEPDAARQESPGSPAQVRALAWLYATMALGLLFVVGQVIGWCQLSASGLLLASSPSSSFFYVLTAMHGLHLLGGVMGLSYAVALLTRNAGAHERRVLGVSSVYWHFMDGLWLYLFALLLTTIQR